MSLSLRHRMPFGFGPMPGPRQGPDGRPFDWSHTPLRTSVSASFLTDGAALSSLLPPGFALEGEPIVTLELQFLRELEWLGGRGYNILGVKFRTRFNGEVHQAVGPFLCVLWENLADPILSGREELGYAKLYAEIAEERVLRGRHAYAAGWLGHPFFRLELRGLGPAEPPAPAAGDDGVLHYKYVPRTGAPGEADVACATLTPTAAAPRVLSHQVAESFDFAFLRSGWEDLPTMAHIVNRLAELPVRALRAATRTETRGGRDLSDQRTLR